MKQIDQHTLVRYFLKQVSEEEKEAVRQWVESSEENRRNFVRERIRFDASILVDEAAVGTSTQIVTGKRHRLHPALSWSLKVAILDFESFGSAGLGGDKRVAAWSGLSDSDSSTGSCFYYFLKKKLY